MSCKETTGMKERMRFLIDIEQHFFSMAELCQRYGVSPKTGDKWIECVGPYRTREEIVGYRPETATSAGRKAASTSAPP